MVNNAVILRPKSHYASSINYDLNHFSYLLWHNLWFGSLDPEKKRTFSTTENETQWGEAWKASIRTSFFIKVKINTPRIRVAVKKCRVTQMSVYALTVRIINTFPSIHSAVYKQSFCFCEKKLSKLLHDEKLHHVSICDVKLSAYNSIFTQEL